MFRTRPSKKSATLPLVVEGTHLESRATVRPPAAKALDALNIFVADMRDGVGPYLALFLIAKAGWTPSRIGWALASASTATLLSTAFAGAILDSSRSKRGWLVCASIAIAIFTAGLIFFTGFWPVLGLQLATGFASAFIGPGIAALSLGLVGHAQLPNRIGRNEMFNHAGNFAAALVAAFLAREFSVMAVFYLVILMSTASAIAVFCIPRRDINDREARGLIGRDAQKSPARIRDVLHDQNFLLFLLIASAFQFSNASLLPIAAQVLAVTSKPEATRFLSYGIVVAQLTAVPLAWLTGITSKRLSPMVCLIFGLSAVILRCLIFAFSRNVDILIGAQILDGTAAGVLAVAPILAIFQITRGSGRFVLAAGILATSIGVGASLSNVVAGYLVESYGPLASFSTMAIVAALTLAFLLVHQGRRRLQASVASLPQPRYSA